MDQPSGEHKDLAFLDGFRDQLVSRGDKPHVELAYEHEQNLGGPRVGVGRVHPASSIVDPRHRHAQRVQAGDLLHIGARHGGPHGAVHDGGLGKAVEREIICRDVGLALAHETVNLCSCRYILSTIELSYKLDLLTEFPGKRFFSFLGFPFP